MVITECVSDEFTWVFDLSSLCQWLAVCQEFPLIQQIRNGDRDTRVEQLLDFGIRRTICLEQ